MISKKGSQILLRSVTTKEWVMPLSHQVADSDRGRSTSSYVRNFDGNVKVGDKFMNRRRHLHPRQLGGNPNNGKIGTDGRNETNEYRFPEPPSHFANFFASQAIVFLDDCAYGH